MLDSRRLGVALVAALMISIAVTSFFYFRVARQQNANRPKTKRVLAAAAALQPGTPVTADNLTEIDWPEGVVLEGLIDAKAKADVVGRVLVYPIAAKEPILRRDVAGAGSFGLAAKIPDGMRAMAVKTNEVNNLAGFLFPGSRVDVLVTYRGDDNTQVTRTVLQSVQVLATGTKLEPDPSGKPENVGVITLLATPEDSEKLVLAQSQGSIHFVLRNSGDSANPDVRPMEQADLLGLPKKVIAPPEVKSPARRVAVVRSAPVYSVETVAGGKTTVAKFSEVSQ
ncbi:MAG: Flp pilus assembly protein CpaB [Terriglobales bacterium]